MVEFPAKNALKVGMRGNILTDPGIQAEDVALYR